MPENLGAAQSEQSRLRIDRILLAVILAIGIGRSTFFGIVTWFVMSQGLLTMHGHMLVVRDYVWLWGAGALLRLGDISTIFHPVDFANWLRTIYGAQLDDHVFGHPPSMLLLAALAGHLPVRLGWALYVVAQAAVLWILGRSAGLSRGIRLAVLVSPAMLETVLAGQSGGLTGAFLAVGFLLAGRRPVLAGICFGLLTIKPQLGLLVPVCLIAARDWKTIASASLTFLALFLVSGALFGFESWVMFVQNVMPFVSGQMEYPWTGMYFQRLLVTPFAMSRFLGFGLTLSFAFQAFFTVSAVVFAWRLWRRPSVDPELRMAITVCLGAIATPYGYAYDMVGVAIAVAILAARSFRNPLSFERPLLAIAWLWPGITAALIPLGFAVIASVAWLGERRLAEAPADDPRGLAVNARSSPVRAFGGET